MRSTVALFLTLVTAPAASAEMLGEKLARTVCSYGNTYYTLAPIEAAAYSTVDVTGRYQYNANAEFFFTKLSDGSGGAICKQALRFDGSSACQTATVSRNGDVLINSRAWTNVSC